jgi:hypothetical protein
MLFTLWILNYIEKEITIISGELADYGLSGYDANAVCYVGTIVLEEPVASVIIVLP